MLANLATTIIYLTTIWFTGMSCVRDSAGTQEAFEMLYNTSQVIGARRDVLLGVKPIRQWRSQELNTSWYLMEPPCVNSTHGCAYGLYNSAQVRCSKRAPPAILSHTL